MSKSLIFWSVSLISLIGLIGFYLRSNFISSADTRLMEISVISGPEELSGRAHESLTRVFSQTPILLWGVFPEDADGLEVLKKYLVQHPFDEVWVDGPWQGLIEGRPVFLRKNEELVRTELKKLLAEGKRVLIVSSPIDVNTSLELSSAWKLDQAGDLPLASLSTSGFPRLRTEEPQMKLLPCILPHADKTGAGWLGCQILNIARSTYRQRFKAGGKVAVIEQIGPKDLILLIATEPEL